MFPHVSRNVIHSLGTLPTNTAYQEVCVYEGFVDEAESTPRLLVSPPRLLYTSALKQFWLCWARMQMGWIARYATLDRDPTN